MKNTFNHLVISILNLIGNIRDSLGHNSTDLNWDVNNDRLLRELTIGIEFENVVSISGGKHKVSSIDSRSKSDPNVDNIYNQHSLYFNNIFFGIG